MAKRISDAERVTAYFQTASEESANVMVQAIKGILNTRFPKAKKKKKPEKPKLVTSEPKSADKAEGVG